MKATWVPSHLTPFGLEEAAIALRAALHGKVGKDPSREVLALALAKTALETNRWRSIFCNNFGNVKCGDTYPGLYCTIELNEVLNGRTVWFSPKGRLDRRGGTVVAEHFEDPPGHPQTRMRAYLSREEGALAYVDFVAGGRYAEAWQSLLVGDAVGYVTKLRAKGYFTAPLDLYLRGVVSLQREFIGRLNEQNLNHETVPPNAAIAAVAALKAAANRAAGMTDVVGVGGANLRAWESDEPPDSEPPDVA